MSYRIEQICQSRYFELTKNRHRKSNKVHYRINLMDWPWTGMQSFQDQVRDTVDPTRTKSGQFGYHWKFRSRNEAEMMYMTLMLKFA